MEDKDFFRECVNHITTPVKTKTNLEMIKIVLQNTYVDVNNMFSDKHIVELFEKHGSNLLGDTYRFIRDNQNLYVDAEYLNITQIDKVIENPNVMNILKSTTYSDRDSESILNRAIDMRNFNIIQHFMEKNIMPNLHTSIFLEVLCKKKEDVKILEYIESKNIKLNSVRSGRLIMVATLHNNDDSLSLLTRDIKTDTNMIQNSFKAYIYQEYESKQRYQQYKNDFVKIATSMRPVLHILMDKLSEETFKHCVESCETEEMRTFLKKEYLSFKLQITLPLKENNMHKNKI